MRALNDAMFVDRVLQADSRTATVNVNQRSRDIPFPGTLYFRSTLARATDAVYVGSMIRNQR